MRGSAGIPLRFCNFALPFADNPRALQSGGLVEAD